ncbi:carbohydrate ABC transporter permease [Marinomonas mediterranea]|uniref:ABC-type transporter, integral membrane subunit n=1 Tax=Marinomonas mediterranea (strain ATCC 700492 / JCM 21426 / NBRC 103028 / MMB-1) TaxID=717774 RepID=F2K040_MARM1|nr:sugar ABC transporter permease [Marinomonas mediterranea]ADZ93254.1 ABC-type transporter, integral membrane subunit [Marinomonas mediterranea MMB-1]WCN11142.1 ABC transporter permease subunit [Marinomonas mediterranea]WCN15205.1 ABC transporter permease subunit [Marinomonas mediterranea]WCN19249.1 ABC transporter permease subunit [Marinomonas mediterranea MMB-1]
MTTKSANSGSRTTQSGRPARLSLADWMPKLVMAPTVVTTIVCIYGYMIWTAVLSFTNSRMLPTYKFVGTAQYERLFDNDRWLVALSNLGVFGGLFILICLVLGVMLAIFLDQKIRAEGAIRTIYLYPMAISFIVTGTAWKWLLNPTNGIEKMMIELGFEDFRFNWLSDPDMVVYCLVIAAVWQASGFVMALFLAGLRGVDGEMIKAAQLDGAGIFTTYRRIILPSLKPVFFSAMVILSHIAIKSFDLVASLTNGGPGYSSDLPANFMYTHAFNRSQMGLGSASAMVMLGCVLAILIPYLYSELRGERHE